MEILVTAGIVATLAAIIAPIYINVVDSARRTKCTKNLSQIGAAILAYEFEYGRLPGPLGPVTSSESDEELTLEDYLIEAGYHIEKSTWICCSFEKEVKPKAGGRTAEISTYVLNNFQISSPPYFFGVAPSFMRSVSLHQIEVENQSGVWLIRDKDILPSSGQSAYNPRRSPGLGKARPPHAKGRNYFYVDGSVRHLKIGAFPDEGNEGADPANR